MSGVDNLHVSRSGDLFVAEDSYTAIPDAMDVCIISPEHEVARFLKLTGAGHFLPGAAQSETTGLTFDPSGTRMYLCSQRFQGSGIVYEISGPFRQARPPWRARDPGAPSARRRARRRPCEPGLPIGIEVARRISIQSLIRTGLALGITLDKAATVRVRLTARLKTRNSRRRRVTLATRRAGPARATRRFASSRPRRRPGCCAAAGRHSPPPSR